MELFRFRQGRAPLLVSIPHAGRTIPSEIGEAMTAEGLATPDTDFFVDRLYGFAKAMGASVLAANLSRYVVDLNRPPDDAALYPGKLATGLAPKFSFGGKALYREGREPGAGDVRARVETYWRPYHDKISAELARIRKQFGHALLWDAHSIKSEVPSLFAGRLPDWNVGTNGGLSCGLAVEPAFRKVLAGKSVVFNGRFKGGFITRNYGKPAEGVHAVQLELVQANYMDEAANAYDQAKAAPTAALLQRLIEAFLELPLP